METIPRHWQTFDVPYRFPVCFTEDVFSPDNTVLRDVIEERDPHVVHKVLVVIDDGVAQARHDLIPALYEYFDTHQDRMALVCDPLVLPGGERCKNTPETVSAIHAHINDFGVCRHSYITAIGGGAFLDAVGYAAATGHRGVRLIRIPTTTLSQADSAMGVKNGVNAFNKKNFIGTFAVPHAVVVDFGFLHTLSDRDWTSGLSEAVKVALIKDTELFEMMEQSAYAVARRSMPHMQSIVHRTATLHLDHIAQGGDPFEHGSSRPLDFGHWSAHTLERLSDFSLRHGEAVSIGIALDATYAYLKGFLPESAWRRILAVLDALGLPLYTPFMSELDSDGAFLLLRGVQEFREHMGGVLHLILVEDIGASRDVTEIDADCMSQSIETLTAMYATHI